MTTDDLHNIRNELYNLLYNSRIPIESFGGEHRLKWDVFMSQTRRIDKLRKEIREKEAETCSLSLVVPE
jgi:hypothetical protein